MPPRGWYARYAEILGEFGYSRARDAQAARTLRRMVPNRSSLCQLREAISSRHVFAVGAGPSLHRAMGVMDALPQVIRVVSDSAVHELVRRKMRIDVIVTDLDGNADSLVAAARRGAIMIVHAHADNVENLGIAQRFARIVPSTQGRPSRGIYNFGGFTDGDRCVFAAGAMRAKSITLLAMDFGVRIGRHSMTRASQRQTKLRKLRRAKALLEWGVPHLSRHSELYSMSRGIAGFTHVGMREMKRMFA